MKKVTNTEKNPQPGWLLGGNPNAILAQEAQGQKELIESDQLPSEVNTPRGIDAKMQYVKMGIKVVGQTKGDDLFLDVVLPAGWKKESTSHSMWNHLKDDKGRIRATFFYKAAFYDRKSEINFMTRYRTDENYFNEEKNPKKEWDVARQAVVVDTTTDQILFTSAKYFYDDRHAAYKTVADWMDEKYPNWKDVNAYWD